MPNNNTSFSLDPAKTSGLSPPDANRSTSTTVVPTAGQTSKTEPAVITVVEAAQLLRVNHKTLRDAITRGDVPGVIHVGRIIRISRKKLLAWAGLDGPTSTFTGAGKGAF